MKFTVPKESNRRQTPASSFFVEGEQQKKREEPLEVPAFMRRVPVGAQKNGTGKKSPPGYSRRSALKGVAYCSSSMAL